VSDPEIPKHLLARAQERRRRASDEELREGTNYFDAIDTLTELARQLLDVLAPPLRLPWEGRPYPRDLQYPLDRGHEQLVNMETPMPAWPLVLRVGSSSIGIYVRLTTPDGQLLRTVVWPYSDEPIDLTRELP
jgi:hypothetical protein